MKPTEVDTVFNLAPVPEIRLARAPLEKVLTQVQFSRAPALVSDEGEERLAAVLGRYPVRRQAMALNLVVGLGAAPIDQKSSPTWVFANPSQSWQVTVSDTSVGLETTEYDSRDDFCQRAREAFDAVSSVDLPPIVDRVGLRYVDRLRGDNDLGRLGDYVTSRLCVLHGAVDVDLPIEHSVTETVIRIADDERLKVRSGLLPPGALFDPVLLPASEPTWVLDIDVFTSRGGFPFDPASLEERLRRYAEHAYSFFRWATTDAFQRDFQASRKDGATRSAL